MQLEIIGKEEWCNEPDEQAPKRASRGDQEVVAGQLRGWRAQLMKLAMADHTAGKQCAKIG